MITKLLVKVNAAERGIKPLIRGDFCWGIPASRFTGRQIKKPALKRAFEMIMADYIVIISFSFSATSFCLSSSTMFPSSSG